MKFLERFKRKAEVHTIPIEEHNKTKQALQESYNCIATLEKSNETIVNHNDITLAEIEYIESEIRIERIKNILSKLNLPEQERSKLQQILVNSDLSIEFIEETYRPISKKNISIVETKLPQKSIIEQRTDSSFVY